MKLIRQKLFSFGNKIAIMELSTTSVKLLIGPSHYNGNFNFKNFHYESDRTFAGNGINNGKMDMKFFYSKVIPVIIRYMRIAQNYNIRPNEIICVATAAYRESSNIDDILGAIEDMTRINARVLNPTEEATKAITAFYKATKIDLNNKYLVLMDQGGGSTELSIMKDGKLLYNNSFKVGTVIGGNSEIVKLPGNFNLNSKNCVFAGVGGTINKIVNDLKGKFTTQEEKQDMKLPKSDIESFIEQYPSAKTFINIMDSIGLDMLVVSGVNSVYGTYFENAE